MTENKTFLEKNYEIFFEQTGSTWILERIYLYSVTPFGFLAVILNLVNLLTFLKFKIEPTSLIRYMKIFTLNSIMLSLMIFLFIFTHLPRHFSFSLSYPARLYRCVIMINVANMLNFYETILNILIMIERISSFVLKFKKYTNIPPYRTSFLCLILCIIICLPTYFMSYVKSQTDFEFDIENYHNQYDEQISYVFKHKTM